MWDDLVNSYPGIFTPENLEKDSFHQPSVLAFAVERDGNMYFSDMGKGNKGNFAVAMATNFHRRIVTHTEHTYTRKKYRLLSSRRYIFISSRVKKFSNRKAYFSADL